MQVYTLKEQRHMSTPVPAHHIPLTHRGHREMCSYFKRSDLTAGDDAGLSPLLSFPVNLNVGRHCHLSASLITKCVLKTSRIGLTPPWQKRKDKKTLLLLLLHVLWVKD